MPTMRLEGRDVNYEIESIPIDKLSLDPKNPRIQYDVHTRFGGNITQDQLIEELWGLDRTKALTQAIRENHGVITPIVVRRTNGKNVVAEGNRRTVAALKLYEESKDSAFGFMPSHVFGPDLTDTELSYYLSVEHVAGKAGWKPFEKARHIYEQYTLHGRSQDWIATHLQTSKSSVIAMLETYKAMVEYLATHKDEKITQFSFFKELWSKKRLREEYKTDPVFKERFQRWVSTGALSAPIQIRDLERILSNPRALAALDDNVDGKGYENARDLLVKSNPELEGGPLEMFYKATLAAKQFPVEDVAELAKNPNKLKIVRDLRRALEDLGDLARVKI